MRAVPPREAEVNTAKVAQRNGVQTSNAGAEVTARRELPGGGLDSDEDVGDDVRRDGGGIPIRWAVSRSEPYPEESLPDWQREPLRISF